MVATPNIQETTTTPSPAAPPAREKLLTVDEVAKWLDVSREWVRSHANGNRQPGIPCVLVGKLLRFRRADIESFIESQLTEPKKQRFRIT